jgi:MFS family permease
MIRTFLYSILQRRHFWRNATFGEVAELYASRTLRLAAINIGAGFTSVYLLRNGYSLIFIMEFWALIYFTKAIIAPLAGIFVSRFGAAKGTLISNLLYIPAMMALGFMPEIGSVAIIIFAVCMGLSVTLYEVCYFIEFSIIKNPVHAGKEIGFMNILEKITISLSPVIGGFIALTFGAPVTMWFASLLFALAALPLLRNTDKVERQQSISISGFPWRMALPSIMAKAATGFDLVASSIVWGLFLAMFIFAKSNNDIYVILGALTSVTVVVAILISIFYGRTIDRDKGGNLLKFGVVSNALVHLTRIFITTPLDALGVNIVNEAATTAQNMAFLRGMFDTADISGHRIMYLVAVDMMNNVGATIACVVMILCAISYHDGIGSFHLFFGISALAILFVSTARFPIYRK